MGKIIEYGDDARNKILAGVEKLTRAVSVTMGPRGKNVIIGKAVGAPVITKDGVSVAREVVLSDPREELGCQLVKEVAGRTVDLVGDGTTTSTVLACEIFGRGLHLLKSGKSNPLKFKRGIEWAQEAILEEIELNSKKIETDQELIDIATISANNDPELGRIIAGAYLAVDKTGMVTAEAIPGVKSAIKVVDGIELKSGYISSEFLEPGQIKRVMEKCLILICDEEISHMMDPEIIRAIQKIGNLNKEVLLICTDLKKHALSFFLQNFKAGTLKLCAIKTPKFGKQQSRWLEDLSLITGATILGEDHGIPLSQLEIKHLGYAERIEVENYTTKIVNPKLDVNRIQNRKEIYKNDLLKLLGDIERRDIMDRLAFLNNKAAVIQVGYSTELELREKGDRVDDAMSAVRAAIQDGYVVGGGFALWHAVENIRKNKLSSAPQDCIEAINVLLKSCEAPARQILKNAELPEDIILKNIDEKSTMGYNSATEEYGDLVEMGVIDPKKVTKIALQNAISIAQLLIATEAVIADDPNNSSGWQPPAGWRAPSNNGLNHKY